MCLLKFHGGLEFKKLSIFNLSLLAKQGWRISQDKNSLLHRLYKAKYLPNNSFFESQLGRNPSYTWRGIWEAMLGLLMDVYGGLVMVKPLKSSSTDGYRPRRTSQAYMHIVAVIYSKPKSNISWRGTLIGGMSPGSMHFLIPSRRLRYWKFH